MTQQEQCDRIATDLMGWRLGRMIAPDDCWLKDSEDGPYFMEKRVDWNPFENWAHCGMVLDRLWELGIYRESAAYCREGKKYGACKILMGWGEIKIKIEDADSEKTAICLAVLELIANHPEVLR